MGKLYDRSANNVNGYRDVTPKDVADTKGTARMIDVREPAEWIGELGHVDGAELVPLSTVESAAAKWDRDADIVLICRSGGRSGRAAMTLSQMGFKRVMNMVGGMLSWNEHKLPVAR
jgi:rhodanese-related sulfurtransferase